MATVTRAGFKSFLDVLTPTDAPLNGAKVMLFTVPMELNELTTLEDLPEATFPGYARSAAVTWGAPYNNDEGGVAVQGDRKQFTCTEAPEEAETIYGWALITSGGSPALLMGELLDYPVTIDEADDAVSVVPEFALANP